MLIKIWYMNVYIFNDLDDPRLVFRPIINFSIAISSMFYSFVCSPF